MADEDKNKDKGKGEEKEKKAVEKESSSKPAEVKIGIVTWAIMITIIVTLSSSGFVLGRLLAGSSSEEETSQTQEEDSSKAAPAQTKETQKVDKGTWYYNDLEPVIVNPDEPGATRFVRVGLNLEISNELSQDEAIEMIQARKPRLINWLNLYFNSLSLDQMENEKDMNRILSQICDGFNEILFPEAKPQIKKVLIREFNIQ